MMTRIEANDARARRVRKVFVDTVPFPPGSVCWVEWDENTGAGRIEACVLDEDGRIQIDPGEDDKVWTRIHSGRIEVVFK